MLVSQILSESLSTTLGIDVGDTVTLRSGVVWEWKGAKWVITDTGRNSSANMNRFANEAEMETLTNRARRQKGLPPLEFDNGRPVLDRDGRPRLRGETRPSSGGRREPTLRRGIDDITVDPSDRPGFVGQTRTRPSSQNRNPVPSPGRRKLAAWMKTGLAGWLGSKVGPIGVLVSTGLTILEAEEQMDNYLRVASLEIDRQLAAGVQPDDLQITPKMTEQYELVTELMATAALKTITAGVLGYAGGRAIGAAASAAIIFLFGSNFLGWLAALVGGGLLAFYGTEGLEWALKRVGAVEVVTNGIRYAFPEQNAQGVPMFANLMMEVNEFQDHFNIIPGDDPTTLGADSGVEQESISEATITKQDVEDNLKELIKSDEDLMQMFRKGKEKLKARAS